MRTQRIGLTFLLLTIGCSPTVVRVDAGEVDAGEVDAGEVDAGGVDAGCQKDLDCACPTPRCDLETGACGDWRAGNGGARSLLGGSSCANPTLLPIWRSGDSAIVSGDELPRGVTRPPVTDDERGSCLPNEAWWDSIYLVRLCEPMTLTVRWVIQPITGGGFLTYVRSGSCEGPELICAREAAGYSPFARLPDLPTGDYFVFIDNVGRGGMGKVIIHNREGEDCEHPLPLPLDAGVVAISVEVRTHDPAFDSAGCTEGRPDLVYQFTTQAPATLHVRAEGWWPRLALLHNECPANAALACALPNPNQGTPAVMDATVDAGTYLLVVEEHGSDSATLEAWLGPP